MGRRSTVVARVACGVAVLAAGGAITLGVVNGVPVLAKSHLLFVMTCAAAGALVAGARPRNAIGWALLVSAVSFSLLELFGEWAYRGGSAWPETWLWVPANLGMAVVPLLFPDGRLTSRRWSWLLGPIGPTTLPVLPAATEVAAYRIAVEAVTNVCRHAEAGEAVVRLDVDGDRLIVEIRDDGGGACAAGSWKRPEPARPPPNTAANPPSRRSTRPPSRRPPPSTATRPARPRVRRRPRTRRSRRASRRRPG